MIEPKELLQDSLKQLGHRHVDTVWLALMAGFGLVLLVASLWLGIADMLINRAADQAKEDAIKTVQQVATSADELQKVLYDEQVQSLALRALADPEKLVDLRQYLAGRASE
ncbi:MAG TPA: hypothetical protein VKN35_03375, partial [Xanthomonadales bacterium]|nr:hypothetical protein [Xanthomonadales bacterium]